MKFAKRVFMGAGIWGLVVVPPLFFLLDVVNRQTPPAVTHLEFYYGFTAVTTVWQIAFLVVGSDPVRFRPMMLVCVCEKFFYISLLLSFILTHRAPTRMVPAVVLDGSLGCLFIYAWRVTPSRPGGAP